MRKIGPRSANVGRVTSRFLQKYRTQLAYLVDVQVASGSVDEANADLFDATIDHWVSQGISHSTHPYAAAARRQRAELDHLEQRLRQVEAELAQLDELMVTGISGKVPQR